MRVLVTGAGGFLGSHLVERLASLSSDVTAVDIFSKVGTSNISDLERSAEILDVDISRNILDRELPQAIDILFHLGAFSSVKESEDNAELAFRVNVNGTYNLLRLALKRGVKKFIFTSAASLYGREPQHFPIDEGHPIDIASNVYNATKKLGEDLCKVFKENHRLSCVYFRIFNAYGPKQSRNFLIPSLILQALDKRKITLLNPTVRRDFVFVTDVIDAFIKGAESDFAGGPINLGSGTDVSVQEIASTIATELGAELEILEKEVWGAVRLVSNNSLANEILAWEPKVSLRVGLKKTIDWFVAHQDQYRA